MAQFWTTWDGIYALKKVDPDDVSLVVPRVDWEKETVYDEYDSTATNLYTDRNFYVLVADDLNPDKNRIYKCISNSDNNESTIEPDSDVPGVFGTSYVEDDPDYDGYSWVLVGEFDATEYDKFFSIDWMPVTSTPEVGSIQEDVVDSAVNGAVHVIKVVTGGSGYTDGVHNLTVVSPDSTGTGLVATVTVVGGVADEVTVVSPGEGYRECVLEMPAEAGAGTNATFRAVLSPYGGHGYSIVNELKPNSVCVYGLIGGTEEGKLVITNDFRQYGLVTNPRLASDGTLATDDVYYQHHKFTISGITNNAADPHFTLDEWVTVGGTGVDDCTAKGRVLGWDVKVPTVLYLITVRGTISKNDVIKGNTSETTATISLVEETPQIAFGSGEIIYLANRASVSRDEDQKEEFKLIVTY